MLSGVIKFVIAVIVFVVVGIFINPVLSALLNVALPPMAVLVVQICCAGLIVASGSK